MADTNVFDLGFCLCPCGDLDQHALLATQVYNLGDRGKWFLNFRKGLNGFHSRLHGVRTHYQQVHAWQPWRRDHGEPEYHLATIFFHMDSALECFAYALNAFGYGFAPDEFLDITNEKALRAIAPSNIIGTDAKPPVAGYGLIFPELQRYWQANKKLIAQVTDLHDVSKHRSTIYVGGRSRNDPPAGFFEALQVPDEPGLRMAYAPMAEVILNPEPKLPYVSRGPAPKHEDLDTLEALASRFREFVNESARLAWLDAQRSITLPHANFLPRAKRVVAADVPLYEDERCEKPRGDVVGLIVGHEEVGHGITSTSIHPTTRKGHYIPGSLLAVSKDSTNFAAIWGPTWYREPSDGSIRHAWSSSAEHIPEQAVVA